MKDKTLKVIYTRGNNGELFVYLYRSDLHIATIEVDAKNGVDMFSSKK